MPTIELALALSAARPVGLDPLDPAPALVSSELFVWLVHDASTSASAASANASRRVNRFILFPFRTSPGSGGSSTCRCRRSERRRSPAGSPASHVSALRVELL